MEHQNKRRDAQPPVYAVDEPAALLPFLLANVKGKSRNNVKSLLSRRLVAVDGVPVSRFDTPLSPGQQVSILPASAPRAEALPFPILYEDEHLIVVNKPAKLLSVANDKEKTRTAYHMVTDYVKARRVGDRIFVIHRLDRDTSGVLMFARDPETKELFQGRWNEIVARRGYLAVVEGTPKPDRDTIRSFLVETDTHLSFSGAPGPHEGEGLSRGRGQAVRRPDQPHRAAVPPRQRAVLHPPRHRGAGHLQGQDAPGFQPGVPVNR